MELTRMFTILFLIGLFLTTVLSDSTWSDTDADDQDDNHDVSKRVLFGHSHGHSHHHHGSDSSPYSAGGMQPRRCVRCKYSLMPCCPPNVCVKRRLRSDKCLRIKA